jgi:hypothetical protein
VSNDEPFGDSWNSATGPEHTNVRQNPVKNSVERKIQIADNRRMRPSIVGHMGQICRMGMASNPNTVFARDSAGTKLSADALPGVPLQPQRVREQARV